MQKQLSILSATEGSITIQQAARKLRQEKIWFGNEWQLIDLLVLLGVIQKDPVKRQSLVVYKKYFDLGYFDWPCLKSGDPKPLIKSEVVLTTDGWNWLVDKLVAFQEEKTLIGHVKESRDRRLQNERFRLLPR